MKKQFGLIGYPLGHSFSHRYFGEKFANMGLADTHTYQLFSIETIGLFPDLWRDHPDLVGLNVTIPYKQTVIAYLDDLSEAAAGIGAVNTIKKIDGRLKGYNTDTLGFGISLDEFLLREKVDHRNIKALILGTGGAALGVAWSLKVRKIPYQYVSRKAGPQRLTYGELTADVLREHRLIINTTPLGMRPKTDTLPDIPYHALHKNHLLYDLVYNPVQTAFLKAGLQYGCAIQNGLPMLYAQAEYAWDIWQSKDA